MELIKILYPSMFMHMFITLIITHLALWSLQKFSLLKSYSWKAATSLGILISIFYSMDMVIKNYQSKVIASELTQSNAAPTVNYFALKSDFLKAVDFITNNPDQLTVQSKSQLYNQFQPLFPNGIDDVKQFHKEVRAAYECQLALYEDSVNSYKNKSKVESEKSKQCMSLPGTFFGREKLLPNELLKSHEELLTKVEKNEKSIQMKDLQALVDIQKNRLKHLESIFN